MKNWKYHATGIAKCFAGAILARVEITLGLSGLLGSACLVVGIWCLMSAGAQLERGEPK